MTTVRAVYDFLDAWAPFSTAMSFDNAGLLAGNGKEEVRRAVPVSYTHLFAGDEMQQVVALINESRGRYVADPESLDGGSILFTVTMTDGETHTVSNIGNVYLTIDGEYFDAGYEWLSAWNLSLIHI